MYLRYSSLGRHVCSRSVFVESRGASGGRRAVNFTAKALPSVRNTGERGTSGNLRH